MVLYRYLAGYPNMLYITFLQASRRGNKLIKTRVSASSFDFPQKIAAHTYTHVCMYVVYRVKICK